MNKRACVLAVLMNKGGTGKTETSLNLAYGLSKKNKKVLLIDFDPSSNLTSIMLDLSSGISENDAGRLEELYEQERMQVDLTQIEVAQNALTAFLNADDYDIGIGEVLNRGTSIRKAIHETRYENLDIVPSGHELELTDMILKNAGKNKQLRMALLEVDREYDYIVIDCQPFQNSLTYNALSAAYKEGDMVIAPVKINRGGLQGIQSTLKTALDWCLQEMVDYDFRILVTMKNRNATDNKWVEVLRKLFGGYLLNSTIRYQGKPVTSASLSRTVLLENPNDNVAKDYQGFVDEIYEITQANV